MHIQENHEGDQVDMIRLWYETHFNKKTKKWIDEKSEDIYVRPFNLYLFFLQVNLTKFN